MNNLEFLDCLKESFITSLKTHSRSNKKLKILHGRIANDLLDMLGEHYEIKSLGHGKGTEGRISGRYINKNVDITIYKNSEVLAGIGVKFVMQNYSQNSNNYFENMLGETANIRSVKIPYFQIFITLDKIPYFKKDGTLSKWETFSEHNAEKYIVLSNDNVDVFLHTPVKTLIYVINIDETQNVIIDKAQYNEYYIATKQLQVKPTVTKYKPLGSNMILNDYETFLEKIVHYIKSI